MPKIIITGYYGEGNLGDDAILLGVIEGIKQYCPDLEFQVVAARRELLPEQTRPYFLPGNDLTQVYNSIKVSDLVVCGGGGLFQDYYGHDLLEWFHGARMGLNYYLRNLFIAQVLGKPTMVYGAGVGPLQTTTGRQMVKLILSNTDTVTVRDVHSHNLLAELGVDSLVTGDPALRTQPEKTTWHPESQGPFIGLSLRNWSNQPHYDVVVSCLKWLVKEFEFKILLFPMDQCDIDKKILSKVREQLPSGQAHFIPSELTPGQTMYVMQRCSFLLGMRLHFAILGHGAGVPVIALSYDKKVESYMERMNQSDLCINWSSLDITRLKEMCRLVISQNSNIREKIKKTFLELKKQEETNALLAKQLLFTKPNV